MTAFANEKSEIDSWLISWELRSVNHRFLDLSLRLPEGFRFLEPKIRDLTAAALNRGKIDCTLICTKKEAESAQPQVNDAALKQLLSSIKEIEGTIIDSTTYSALDILAWPGILQEEKVDGEKLAAPILQMLKVTLENLVGTREREGARLSGSVQERCALLETQVLAARQRIPIVLKNIREKMVSRFAEISSSPNADRLEQEMVYYAQKSDIAEELDRLDSHIGEVRQVLESPDPIGRRLDFMMQEMNREANTLGSKSVDTTTTQISVEMKVLIEQMREQIQNIE